jgi:hypothetical protein
VYQKLSKSALSVGAATTARDKLQRGDWFLPFKWQ